MSATALNVLLLAGETADALLIGTTLARTWPEARLTRVSTRRDYLDHLASPPVDLVLSDGLVPWAEGIEAFHLARAHRPGVPFVFISGTGSDGDRRALRALGIISSAGMDDNDLESAITAALSVDRPGLDPHRLLAGHEVLLDVTRELARATDLPNLVTLVLATARRLTGADHVTFAVREGDCCHYLDRPDRRVPLAGCAGGWTMQQRRPLVVDDFDPEDPFAQESAMRSAIVVPVRAAQPIAAIGAYWTEPQQLDTTEAWLLQALADSTAVALENVRLRQQLATTAADRTAELAAFTYAVSHDLRAPIRHLEGFSRILLQDVADLAPQVRHGAQRIQDASGHLREMVNGMLTLSRIAQIEVHPQPVDLADLAREVAQSLANAPTPSGTPARAGVVEFVAPTKLPATGDPRLLQTVLQDLLGNAWKFTSRIPLPRVELGLATPETGDEPVYFVKDNGAGFDPAGSDRLFGVFQRLHSGEDFPGTGVGLASVKRIVGKHGGTVRATGTPDEGATFYFTLPR
jgi:signal transduction histidine kinase